MADNVAVTPGSGAIIATDDVNGIQFQRVKMDLGANGVSAPVELTMPVSGSVTVSGSVLTTDNTAPLSENMRDSSVQVAVTSTAVCLDSPTRRVVYLQNAGTSRIWVKFAGTGAAVATGIFIEPGGSFDEVWSGPVCAISTSGTQTLAVQELR